MSDALMALVALLNEWPSKVPAKYRAVIYKVLKYVAAVLTVALAVLSIPEVASWLSVHLPLSVRFSAIGTAVLALVTHMADGNVTASDFEVLADDGQPTGDEPTAVADAPQAVK